MRIRSESGNVAMRLKIRLALIVRAWFKAREPFIPLTDIGAYQLPVFCLLVSGITMAESRENFFKIYAGRV